MLSDIQRSLPLFRFTEDREHVSRPARLVAGLFGKVATIAV